MKTLTFCLLALPVFGCAAVNKKVENICDKVAIIDTHTSKVVGFMNDEYNSFPREVIEAAIKSSDVLLEVHNLCFKESE